MAKSRGRTFDILFSEVEMRFYTPTKRPKAKTSFALLRTALVAALLVIGGATLAAIKWKLPPATLLSLIPPTETQAGMRMR